MQRAWLFGVPALLLLLSGGCTQDFDSFRVGTGGSSANGGVGGASGASSGGAAGAAGTIVDGGGGSAGNSTTGGSAGAAGSGGAAGASGAAGTAGSGGCIGETKDCDGTCVDITDPSFGCGVTGCAPCAIPNALSACDGAVCAIAECTSGFADCNGDVLDGCEVELATDVDHCGACFRDCVLPGATASCEGSVCEVASCDLGFTDCDGDATTGCEVNTGADPRACGSCTEDCFDTPGNWVCMAGSCESSPCPAGLGNCDGTGCNVNTNTSLAHCGFCGNACAPAHATGTCVAGQCGILACDTGFADCDGSPANGCERDLRTDPDHCGTCNRSCSASGVTARLCEAGVCNPTCSAGFDDCSTPVAPQPDNGCEINLNTNPDHCGSCNRACSATGVQVRACSAGQCAPTCQSGFGNCTNPAAPSPDNGCETNISSSTANCGACGRTCATVGVQALSCTSGLCTSTCTGTLGNCSRPAAPAPDDGCELNLGTSLDNCGACGRSCSADGVVTRSCSAGSCNSTCATGRGNCIQPGPGLPDDGCEATTTTDPDNCGGCGRPCSSTNTTARTCSAGLCNSPCQAGFGNCDQPAAPNGDNGCEVPLSTNVNHCGACNRACSTSNVVSQSCSGGVCNSSCVGDRGNCNQPAAPMADDGCEANLLTDVSHCGSCGRGCSDSSVASLSCAGGACNSTCDLGFGNCTQPGSPAADNGCEAAVSATAVQCGGCGQTCPAGFTCTGNSCRCDGNGDCGPNSECQSGVCECNRIGNDELCRQGEVCVADGVTQSKCGCNGGNPCGSGQTCCTQGCRNTSTDAAHCGACGHACPPSFLCSAGGCVCNGDASCNAGSAGTCMTGACRCGAMTCTVGQRCLPGGSCG